MVLNQGEIKEDMMKSIFFWIAEVWDTPLL